MKSNAKKSWKPSYRTPSRRRLNALVRGSIAVSTMGGAVLMAGPALATSGGAEELKDVHRNTLAADFGSKESDCLNGPGEDGWHFVLTKGEFVLPDGELADPLLTRRLPPTSPGGSRSCRWRQGRSRASMWPQVRA